MLLWLTGSFSIAVTDIGMVSRLRHAVDQLGPLTIARRDGLSRLQQRCAERL